MTDTPTLRAAAEAALEHLSDGAAPCCVEILKTLRAALAAERTQRGPSAEASARAEFGEDVEPPQPPSDGERGAGLRAAKRANLVEALTAAEARIAELEAATKPPTDAEIEAWREGAIEEINAAVDLMRRAYEWAQHDDRLTRLREWAAEICDPEDPTDVFVDVVAKIDELLAETKGGSDG